MNTMTKQDLFTVTEVAKNKIIERLVTKYDVQSACDGARDSILSAIQAMQLENQALIRHSNAQKDQAWRKVGALEDRITQLHADVKRLQRTLDRLAGYDYQAGEFSEPEPSGLSLPVK